MRRMLFVVPNKDRADLVEALRWDGVSAASLVAALDAGPPSEGLPVLGATP